MKKVLLLSGYKTFSCILLSFFSMLLCRNQAAAQKQPDIDSMNVVVKLHVNPNPADTLDPTYDVTYKLILNDTVSLKKIHLNAGLSQGDKDIFNLNVKLDGSTNLPKDVTYQRKGNVAVITFIAQHLRTDYYYQAKTEDNNGNLSNPKTYRFK